MAEQRVRALWAEIVVASRAVFATMLLAAVLAGLSVVAVGPAAAAPAQEGEPVETTPSVVTTSTLPESNEEFGRIIPTPNSGAEPQDPGDPGGWQQLALFVLVCAVILAMTGWVWWRSRIRRERRRAAGEDPVEVAKREGADVRGPRPPGIVD